MMTASSYDGYFGGAVDLGAFKNHNTDPYSAGESASVAGQRSNTARTGTQAATDPTQGLAEPLPESAHIVPGPWILELNTKNLQTAVTASMQVPYIVIFNSASSPNSQTLRAQMEALAYQYQGRFGLGIVDTDHEAELVRAFGVSAVPAGVALLQGQPIPLFEGLPTQDKLAESVAKLRMAGEQYGLNGVLDGRGAEEEPEDDVPPLHKEGLDALQAGDLDHAHDAYSKALKENPGDTEALTALRQVELLQRVKIANPEGTAASASLVLQNAAEAPITDIEIQLAAADIEVAFNRPDAAFARLIDVIRQTEGDIRDSVRQRLIELFDVVGTHTDIVKRARRTLSNALF